jgi:hypothetical protein
MRDQRFWLASTILSISSLTLLAIGWRPTAGQTPKPTARAKDTEDKASLWMKQKLLNSKAILEGLTREDFKLIQDNAQTMQFMGYLERWLRKDAQGYKEQLHAFEYANAALVRAARDKNLDGATLAYTQLTISCVQCHKIVRSATR